jgi:Tfp pilus assembly protein PilO
MFGTAEYFVIALGMLSLLSAFLFYMFVVTPAQSQLSRQKAERDRLEKELTSNQEKFKGFTTTEEHVAGLVRSVDNFENTYLPVAGNGRTALYQRLNTLIAGYGLVNTAGPDYAPLDINQGQGQSENERGRAKYQSLFPGVYVSMTVEGSYQNLRRFLRDIETSQQFVIVSAVEFEPSENNEDQPGGGGATTVSQPQQPRVSNPDQPYARVDMNQPQGMMSNPMQSNPPGMQQPQQQQGMTTVATQTNRPPAPRGKTIGETVSLRIELAAYFKRNLTNPFTVQQQQ